MPISATTNLAMKRATTRLHHLSMRIGGAFVELAKEKKVGLLPSNHPGLHEARSLIDCALLCRAEINALTALLVKAKVFTEEDFAKQCVEEYEYLTRVKAQELAVEVTDVGIVITNPNQPGKN